MTLDMVLVDLVAVALIVAIAWYFRLFGRN
jgi:hypothetical protein